MRFRHHVFVCENRRPDDDPRGCCAAKGSEEIRDAFKAEIHRRGLKGQIRANGAGCLDNCAQGPTVVVYPEGVWYTGVTPDDVRAWWVLDRILLLTPGQLEALRDRGLVSARLGVASAAERDLGTYLARSGDAADAAEVRRVLAGLRGRRPLVN